MAIDQDVEIEALATVIEQDPALTAKVLGVANSAYYAPRQPIVTIKQAIIQVLGLRMVGNLAIGITLNGVMSNAGCERFDMARYWVTALGTAELCSGLMRAATLDDKPDPDVAYLVGLLHNLGELLLVHLRPTQMNEVLRRLEERPELDVVEIEHEVLGIDRWGAGAFLARHWELPPIVADSIEHFGLTRGTDRSSPMTYLLGAARHWIDGVIHGRSDALHVIGVDEAYCEYRASSFVEGFESLQALAGKMQA